LRGERPRFLSPPPSPPGISPAPSPPPVHVAVEGPVAGAGAGGVGAEDGTGEDDWVALAHGKSASSTGGRRREMVKIGDSTYEVRGGHVLSIQRP
jgi:hypothetical protein